MVFAADADSRRPAMWSFGLLGELQVWQYFNPSARKPYSVSEVVDCPRGYGGRLGESVLSGLQDRSVNWRWEAVIALLLTLLAFVVRIDRLGFNSLSEDESAKWLAVQEYRQGHFAGVNSEHPMMPKMLAWASLVSR